MFVVLGLGSNRSFESLSCTELLSMAIKRIGGFVEKLCVSSVYRTAAMYVTDQDDFYNMVVAGDFRGTPRQLLEKIHAVEAELGRDRAKEFRNVPSILILKSLEKSLLTKVTLSFPMKD